MPQPQSVDKSEIAKQLVQNIYEITDHDFRGKEDLFDDLLIFEEGKLVKILFGGLDLPKITGGLFTDIDVKDVKEIIFNSSNAKLIEEGTFDRFESLKRVEVGQKMPFDEVHLSENIRNRVRFDGLYLKSDDEIAYKIAQQFVYNYQELYGIDLSDQMNYKSARPGNNGFRVEWGELIGISMSFKNIPKLGPQLFDGIDVSKVKRFEMRESELEEIANGTFDRFTSLWWLRLDENKLTTLPRICDDVLRNLNHVNLEFNKIRDWYAAFENMTDNIEVMFENKRSAQIFICVGPTQVTIRPETYRSFFGME